MWLKITVTVTDIVELEGKCSLRRSKSTPIRKAKLLWMTSHHGPDAWVIKPLHRGSATVPKYAG